MAVKKKSAWNEIGMENAQKVGTSSMEKLLILCYCNCVKTMLLCVENYKENYVGISMENTRKQPETIVKHVLSASLSLRRERH